MMSDFGYTSAKASGAGIWRAIDRKLNRADIQSICRLVLVLYLLSLVASFVTQVSGRTTFGSQLGADYGAFYVAGTIYNTIGPEKIYDRALQREVYHRLFPTAPANEELPYVNSPFFVLPFPLLARLPYAWSYLAWLLISLGLFIAGFKLLWSALNGMPERDCKVFFLVGLSFMPFLVECLAGGQTSAVGFFALALAISAEQNKRWLMSGFTLSLCSYKPTLLLLILPMLLLTRRFRTLAGFAGGIIFLSLISWTAVGWSGCLSYLKMLFYFADASTAGAGVLKSWKYVDVNSFSRLLFGDHLYLRWGLIGAALLVVLPRLATAWWKADREADDQRHLIWALTITWTLVTNIYLGIYDVTLVILSVVLATGVFYRDAKQNWGALDPRYKLLLLSLYLAPWITQPVAWLSRVQLLTVVLALFGAYQLHRLGDRVDLIPASERRFA
jgi:hypothetical protein